MRLNQRAAQLADWIMSNDMTKFPPLALLASIKSILAVERWQALEDAAVIADRFTCGSCGMDGKAAAAIRQAVTDDDPGMSIGGSPPGTSGQKEPPHDDDNA